MTGSLRLERDGYDLVGDPEALQTVVDAARDGDAERCGRADALLAAAGQAELAGVGIERVREAVAAGVASAGSPLGAGLAALVAPEIRIAVMTRTASSVVELGGGAMVTLREVEGVARLEVWPPTMHSRVLCDLVDLSPRPRAPVGAALTITPEVLTAAFAGGSLDVPAEQEELLRATVAGLVEHWRVECRWAGAPGEADARSVEVVDSTAGLLGIAPTDDGRLELWTTDPTAVYRDLSVLLPEAQEMAAGTRPVRS